MSTFPSEFFLIAIPGLGSSSSSHWDLMGTAMITTETVRLTPDLQSRQGAVWSRIVSFELQPKPQAD